MNQEWRAEVREHPGAYAPRLATSRFQSVIIRVGRLGGRPRRLARRIDWSSAGTERL